MAAGRIHVSRFRAVMSSERITTISTDKKQIPRIRAYSYNAGFIAATATHPISNAGMARMHAIRRVIRFRFIIMIPVRSNRQNTNWNATHVSLSSPRNKRRKNATHKRRIDEM